MQRVEAFVQYNNLETEGAALVRRLGGRWSQGGGMCRCPAHKDRTPSLSVRTGRHSLLFKCFAGCDTLDVLRALRRLGRSIPYSASSYDNGVPTVRSWLSIVHRLWAAGQPVGSTAGARYLAGRGIIDASGALRFHPAAQLGPTRCAIYRPALLAAVHDSAGIVAVQRIFLDPSRDSLAKDVDPPRRLLGRPGSGCVRLAPVGDCLGLAEGVETALSAMQLLGFPVWATLGNERFAHVAIPAGITRLILLPDNDRAGRLAETRARSRHAAAGRTIETIWPWHGFNDWNDVLRARGKGEEIGCGQVP